MGGSHSAPRCKRGRTIGENYVLGSAQLDTSIGEVFAINANLGERYLLTTDGLYLAGLYQDGRGAPDSLPETPRRGMSIGGCSAGGESFGGEFFRNPLDGKVYLGGSVGGCREASVLAQVTGLESTRRLPTQTIDFSPEQHAAAAQLLALRAEREAAAKNLAIAGLKEPADRAAETRRLRLEERSPRGPLVVRSPPLRRGHVDLRCREPVSVRARGD